jgi:hypothetical protein
MSELDAKYTFLPWLRKGFATKIIEEDTANEGNWNAIERPSLNISVKLNNTDINKEVKIYGPGDVIGISSNVIVRAEPSAGTKNFEPNYLAYIEFYEEDFPWRYTPASPNDLKIRPWLILLVLKNSELEKEFDFVPFSSGPLPYITVHSELNTIFPSKEQTWAWAHIHANASIENNTEGINSFLADLQQNPDLALSRIICPRKLNENTSYTAFLVPAFETGRLAGLGKATTGIKAQKHSWSGGNIDNGKNFPVYYQWNFETGIEGDFENLAEKLDIGSLTDAGKRNMDINDPGFGIDTSNTITKVIGLESALKPIGFIQSLWPDRGNVTNNYYYIQAQQIYSVLPKDVPYNENVKYFNNLNKQINKIIDLSKNALPEEKQIKENIIKIKNITTTSVPKGVDEVQFYLEQLELINGILRETFILVKDDMYFVDQLETILNSRKGISFDTETGTATIYNDLKTIDDPIITPPVYGISYVPDDVEIFWEDPKWINELNLDPRQRAIAGIGAQVVRQNQSEFMEIAWSQVDGILNINQMIKEAELVIQTDYSLYNKYLPTGNINQLLDFLSPMQNSIIVDNNTLNYQFKNSQIPSAIGSVVTKKIFGRAKRFFKKTGRSISQIGKDLYLNFNRTSDPISAAPPKKTPDNFGLTVQQVIDSINKTIDELKLRDIKDLVVIPEQSYTSAGKYLEYFQNFNNTVLKLKDTEVKINPVILPLENWAEKILDFISPLNTISKAVFARYSFSDNRLKNNNLRPILAYPEIPFPTFEYLRKISSEFLISNLKNIPDNTVTALDTNTKFIEAFMVGLNHEMGKELMWNEYPTDMQGTYFRKFWDDNDYFGEGEIKLKEINLWNSSLGDNIDQDFDNSVFLIIRGELFRKYPNVLIYAQKSNLNGTTFSLGEDKLYPESRANITEDTYLLKFKISSDELLGDLTTNPGWFFIFQERPGQLRFGLDITETPDTIKKWSDLSWQHLLTENGNTINIGSSIDSYGDLNTLLIDPELDKNEWNSNSANTAYIFLQMPYMMAIHAKTLLNQLS